MAVKEEFLRLLKLAVGRESPSGCPLTEEEWNSVYVLAKKQSVMGVVYSAVMSLPADQRPPLKPKLKLALTAEKIQQKNSEADAHIRELTEKLHSIGLDGVLLKGQGVARLYPNPSLRQSGDIDLWLNAPRESVLQKLSSIWKIGLVCYHHADVFAFDDKTGVEIHFYPTWFNSPFNNRKLQAWFSRHFDECLHNVNPELGCAVTTVSFDCVFSLVHIYRHLLFEGIGLRQLMDYYYILMHSTQQERSEAYDVLCDLGMQRFVAAAMYALEYFYGLPQEYMLCEADSHWGGFFVEEVKRSGNFGYYDKRIVRGSGLIPLASSRLKRLFSLISIAPSEVLWAPIFKCWQFTWRTIKNYR